MWTKPILITLAALTAAPAFADGHGHGHGRGWGQGHVPPGHQKRMYPVQIGQPLPEGYIIIRDYDRYGLPAPGADRYARYNGEIYRIARDTATVLSAIQIVGEWLN